MTTPRLAPSDRRRLIVLAARSVMLKSGLAASSLREIAQEAGVSVGTVTYHFRSIDDILREVVTRETEDFYSTVVAEAHAAQDPRIGIRRLIEPMFADTDSVREHWKIWSDYWALVGRRPEIAETYAGQIRVWEDACAEIVTAGCRSGVFTDVPAREMAIKLAAYSDGIAIQRAQDVPGLDASAARKWMLEFAEALLGCSFED